MSSSERLPRTILPKAEVHDTQASDSVFEEGSGLQDDTSAKTVRNSPQIRSNIRSACLACRQRRSKCTGGSPCNRCQTLGTDCVYEEGQDRRTRAIRERGKEELELHKKVLDGLFRAIRNGGDRSLMALVRDNASLHDMAAAIDGEELNNESQQETKYGDELSHPTEVSSTSKSKIESTGKEEDKFSSHEIHDRMHLTTRRESAEHDLAMSVDGHTTNSHQRWTVLSASDQARTLPNAANMSYQHMLAPLHDPSPAILDHISQFYVQFRETGGHMLRQGIQREIVTGSANVRCDLLFRARQNSDSFNIYTWAATVVNGYPELDLYFRLSWLVLLVRFMRWATEMTEENFERIPQLMRPTSLQVSIQHAPFIDLAPLPQIRDTLVHKPRDFCAAFQLSGVSVSWHRSLEEAVLHDPITGSMTVSGAFESHISNPDHFVFGQAIHSVFPELAGKIRTVAEDFIPATTLMPSTADNMSLSTMNT